MKRLWSNSLVKLEEHAYILVYSIVRFKAMPGHPMTLPDVALLPNILIIPHFK